MEFNPVYDEKKQLNATEWVEIVKKQLDEFYEIVTPNFQNDGTQTEQEWMTLFHKWRSW